MLLVLVEEGGRENREEGEQLRSKASYYLPEYKKKKGVDLIYSHGFVEAEPTQADHASPARLRECVSLQTSDYFNMARGNYAQPSHKAAVLSLHGVLGSWNFFNEMMKRC